MAKNKIYFENLDGLRFLCFLSVFFFHSFHTEFDYISNSPIYIFIKEDIFGNGNLGVNFFFVLSGFLITYLLIEEKKLNGKINITRFWIRRILRIWPLFYSCVIFGFFIFPFFKTLMGQTPNETASLLHYLTFLNNFDFINKGLPDASNLGVLWSVAIEEQFYLLWPLILFFLPIKRYWIVFTSIIMISIVFRGYNDTYMMHEYHTLSCIGDMAVGSFFAWRMNLNKGFKLKIINLSKNWITLIYLICFVLFFFKDELLTVNFFTRVTERLIISIIFGLIILEQSFSKNSIFKMSNFKRISKLGLITYGLYCLHFIGILIAINITKILDFNTKIWQVLLIDTSLALIITIFISKLSFNYLEKPFLKIKNKFSYISK